MSKLLSSKSELCRYSDRFNVKHPLNNFYIQNYLKCSTANHELLLWQDSQMYLTDHLDKSVNKSDV